MPKDTIFDYCSPCLAGVVVVTDIPSTAVPGYSTTTESSRPWAMAGADDVAGDDFVGVVVVVCIVIGNIF